MKVTILGCGHSPGVPVLTGDWGKCDPLNPKNYRTRCSAMVHFEGKNILIDASPDLREQLLREQITSVDHVLLTHPHYDHIGGVEDLRPFYFQNNETPVNLWGDQNTLESVYSRCAYLFGEGNPEIEKKTVDYPCVFQANPISEDPFEIEDLRIIPFLQDHGTMDTLGFRFPRWAYSTDVVAFSERALDCLKDLDLWIVNCAHVDPRPHHAYLELVLSWVEHLKPKRTVLTHMGNSIDYQSISYSLPEGVVAAYDGLTLEVQ